MPSCKPAASARRASWSTSPPPSSRDCSGLHALADFTAELGRGGRHCRIVGASAATRRLVVLADFATTLALDGPLYLPAVAPEPVVRRRPDGGVGFSTASVAAAAAAGQRPRRRPPAAPHPAPFRRRENDPASGRRGSSLTLRRWR